MYNKITLVGRITSTPELSRTSNNVPYVRLTIAVNRPNYSGNGNEIADFIPLVAWRQSAEFITNNLAKGSLILVEGSLHSSTYNSNQTNQLVRSLDVTVDRVVALESKAVREMRTNNANANNNSFTPSFNTPANNVNQQRTYQRNENFDYSYENTTPNVEQQNTIVETQTPKVEQDLSAMFEFGSDLDE
ncbi:single-stranded DNA-binding protein [Mycoplasmopsis verecunda]|uniref:Single-stranded DNA-binding protein n=1 Tax=Mycoplasmopsis verecunda TaxID=171291 RepID=A0A1T4KFM7_9BACT|nr:single-stranded DNA-binding protein [Mycoplasmopsis verecunda]WPB54888.1 single-stranded DNA-binding protein [Mycoplasmopsis verecunda]SJZ41157.1 single-strand DNA-binding protein [Mycoplasmopsis verecunda]